MGNPTEDMANFLGTTSVGTAGTDIFALIPDLELSSGVRTPDNIIGVISFGGDRTIKQMGGVIAWEIWNFQFQIRNNDQDAAEGKAYDVMQALDGVTKVEIDGTEYNYMTITRLPFALPSDDKERFRYALEAMVWKRPSGQGLP